MKLLNLKSILCLLFSFLSLLSYASEENNLSRNSSIEVIDLSKEYYNPPYNSMSKGPSGSFELKYTKEMKRKVKEYLSIHLGCHDLKMHYSEYLIMGTGRAECAQNLNIKVLVSYDGLSAWNDLNVSIKAFKEGSLEPISFDFTID